MHSAMTEKKNNKHEYQHIFAFRCISTLPVQFQVLLLSSELTNIQHRLLGFSVAKRYGLFTQSFAVSESSKRLAGKMRSSSSDMFCPHSSWTYDFNEIINIIRTYYLTVFHNYTRTFVQAGMHAITEVARATIEKRALKIMTPKYFHSTLRSLGFIKRIFTSAEHQIKSEIDLVGNWGEIAFNFSPHSIEIFVPVLRFP